MAGTRDCIRSFRKWQKLSERITVKVVPPSPVSCLVAADVPGTAAVWFALTAGPFASGGASIAVTQREGTPMAESENMAKGREVRRQLIGERAIGQMASSIYDDPMMVKFRDYATEAVFGMLWTRPGLDM